MSNLAKKSKYKESHSVSIEGILDIENMTIEVEDIGTKPLKDVLVKLDGCNIKLGVTLSNELE